MNEDTIGITLYINADDIRILSEEINNCNSMYISQFIETVLKKVKQKTNSLEKLIKDINEVNPFKGDINEKL